MQAKPRQPRPNRRPSQALRPPPKQSPHRRLLRSKRLPPASPEPPELPSETYVTEPDRLDIVCSQPSCAISERSASSHVPCSCKSFAEANADRHRLRRKIAVHGDRVHARRIEGAGRRRPRCCAGARHRACSNRPPSPLPRRPAPILISSASCTAWGPPPPAQLPSASPRHPCTRRKRQRTLDGVANLSARELVGGEDVAVRQHGQGIACGHFSRGDAATDAPAFSNARSAPVCARYAPVTTWPIGVSSARTSSQPPGASALEGAYS